MGTLAWFALLARLVRAPFEILVDASPWGCGICSSVSTSGDLQHVGSFSERWRFKHREVPARLLAHKQIYDGLVLREGVTEADAFMHELRRKFPDYDGEDLAALAESVDNTHYVPFVDADALPVNGKW